MISFLNRIYKNRVIKNSSWIVMTNVFQMLIALIVGMIAARYLGPSNYGVINYVAAFVSFFIPISTLGMEGVLVSEFTKHKYPEGTLIGTAVSMSLITSTLSSVSIILLVGVLKAWNQTIIIVAFLQSLTLVFRAFQAIEYWYQSRLLSKYTSIVSLIGYIAASAYKLYLVITGKSIEWFAFAMGVDTLTIAIGLCVLYGRSKGSPLRLDIRVAKQIILQSYPFILSGMVGVVFTQMDKVMIEQMLDDSTQTGLYSAAMNICNMWVFVPQAIITSARPTIMELKHKGDPQYLIRLRQLYSVLIWMCIAASIGITLLAKPLVYILYGKAYAGAAKPLVTLIWYEVFSMIGTARGIWILCENKNKFVWRYLIIGSISNLVLNYSLIPLLGIQGAAIATLITQIITALIAPLLYKQTRIHTKYVLQAFLLTDIRKSYKNRRMKK